MKNKVIVIVFLLILSLLVMQSESICVSAEGYNVHYHNFGANNTTGYESYKGFWERMYKWFILTPIFFFMALPWILWAYNKIRAEHEEDPQAAYKTKRWFSTAIVIDIVLGLVAAGVIFGWFKALVTGG